MNKDKIERICESAGMKAQTRERFRDVEIFIADGFSLPPHRAYQRFGVDPLEFPRGMYATLWWVSRGSEKLDTGQPLFFDVFHNPEYGSDDKRQARVNKAREVAREFVTARKKLNA